MSGAVSPDTTLPVCPSSLIKHFSAQHTVNEKAGIDAHLQIVKFVHALVQAANDYKGEE